MSHELERLDSRPLYIKAQAKIRELIENGVYGEGDQLPPEENLAASLGISRATVRMALGRLESLGMVVRIQGGGGGTFVAKRQPFVLDTGLETLKSLHPSMSKEQGLSSKITNLEIYALTADGELAQHLSVEVGAALVCVERMVSVDDASAAYLCDYVPQSIVSLEELKAGFKDSMIDFFAERPEQQLMYSITQLGVHKIEPRLAALFEVPEGEPLLQLDEAFYSASHQLIDWSRNYFLPDRFRLHLVRRVVIRA